MEITLESIKAAYANNNLIPIRNSFGGLCGNGTIACCPMVALYINETKDLPTAWADESYNDKVCQYLRNIDRDINYLAIGWDNYFPIQELTDSKKNLFELGLQAAKVLGVS